MSAEGGAKAVLAALGANLGIGATKFLAFGLTGSTAMLAESIHSVADSGNQILLLVGARRARHEATDEHPFGYSRARYYYAFLVAVVLFTVGGLYALYEAWHKFSRPEPIDAWRWVPLVVLGVAIVLESLAQDGRARVEQGPRAPELARVRPALPGPQLPVILLEDLAALTGLVFALVGVGLTLITGDGRWDAAGTAAIGALLVAVALVLGRETKSMLIGESATPEDIARIRTALGASSLGDVVHLRTMHLGPDDVLVAAKVAAPGSTPLRDVAAAVDDAEARIREAVPAARLIYIETDVRREEKP